MDIVICTSNFPMAARHVSRWAELAMGNHRWCMLGDGVDAVDMAHPDVRACVDSLGSRWITWACRTRRGCVGMLQWGWDACKDSNASEIAFIHDDVLIHEQGWDLQVENQFRSPHPNSKPVGVVGFGGAYGLGTHKIYEEPYRIQNMIRIGYASNVDDAEVHGMRFDGNREVATVDGFAMIVSKDLLRATNGWPVDKLVFHQYDNWLCCMARRLGFQVRMVGVRCQHLGGRTSLSIEYNTWAKSTLGKSDADIHREAHEWFYEEFRDVLPIMVDTKQR